jgi:ATP-dependent DNA helicase
MIYRLITGNTVDQRILERAEGKRKLEKMVMHKGRFKGRQRDEKSISPEGMTMRRCTSSYVTGIGLTGVV